VLEAELLEGVRPGFASVDGYAAEATREFLLKRRNAVAASHGSAQVRRMDGVRGLWGGIASLRAGRPWITNLMLCLLGMGLVMLTREYVWEYGGAGHYVIGGSGCSGWSVWVYVAAIMVVLTQPVNRATLGIVIGFAVAFQAVLLFADPFSSSDIYRYVWDGVVQHAHVNPYRYVPGDPVLSWLRAPNRDVFDGINRRDYAHTIYPPAAQMIYWLVTFLSPTVTGMKAAMFGFECVAGAALLALLRHMGRAREQVLLYAWCPLLVWEIGGGGHVDAAVFAFVVLALLFRYREQPVLTGLFLGLAVMTKFYPLVLLPALYKRGDWKMPATLAAVVAVGYAVYSSVGMMVFGFLSGYSKEEGLDSGTRYFLLELAQRVRGLERLPVSVYMLFCVAVLGGISVWAWRFATMESFGLETKGRSRFPAGMTERKANTSPAYLRATMMLAFAMMLLFSPHYAWYIVWLIPLFALTPSLPLLAYLMGFFYLFTTALADPGPKMFLLNKILYGGVAAVMVLHALERRWGSVQVRAKRV